MRLKTNKIDLKNIEIRLETIQHTLQNLFLKKKILLTQGKISLKRHLESSYLSHLHRNIYKSQGKTTVYITSQIGIVIIIQI